MVEAVVVGAGVAGSATAIHLARLGRSVLLLDRAEFPRRKPCGEGLFPRGVKELRELGVLGEIHEAVPLETLRFHGYGESAEARLGTTAAPALGVSRAALDKALLEQARREGVEVRCGMRPAHLFDGGGPKFELIADRRYMDAGAIIAADGLGSGLRRQAGIGEKRRGSRYGVTVHVEVRKGLEPAVQVHFCRGYEIYLTPVAPRVLNVALLTSRPLIQRFGGNPEKAMLEFLHQEPFIPAGWRFVDAAMVAGPFPVRPKHLWNRNLVLAGDAAGFFDGITGEGMSLALASARSCAESVHGYLDDGDTRHFMRYEAKRRRMARNSELLGRLTLLLSKRPWTARRSIRGLGRRPASFSRLLAVSSGEASIRSLRPWDLAAPILG